MSQGVPCTHNEYCDAIIKWHLVTGMASNAYDGYLVMIQRKVASFSNKCQTKWLSGHWKKKSVSCEDGTKKIQSAVRMELSCHAPNKFLAMLVKAIPVPQGVKN